MKKKKQFKKFKKKELISSAFIALLVSGYYCGIEAYSIIVKSKGEVMEVKDETSEISLVNKFVNSSHIYLSDKDTDKIKIFDEYIESIKHFLNTSTMQIREPISFKPTYEGLSSLGVKLYTDLDVIKLEDFGVSKYYKVAEGVKKDFQNLLKKAIYFSTDSLKNSKEWKEVKVIYKNKNEEKTIRRSGYEEFASKLSIVRSCGKIQPEKSLKNSKKNFEITILTKNNMTYKITIMGKDYVKINLDNENEEYFEVKSSFFDYLSNIFAK